MTAPHGDVWGAEVKMIRLMPIFVALVALGCGGGTSPGDACRDAADAIASAVKDCGGDYQANYNAFIQSAAGGDCDNVKALRDEKAFVNDCIPALRSLSCEELSSPSLTLPSFCLSQLER